ncbi:hypothetical protein GALL_543840 [mine drainage metagenome]|uniref:Uncharacterized protein n=1 Tax=mine drainage metagenome TaxID=410659 RepID=A0A1J5NZ27_9ZZZZ
MVATAENLTVVAALALEYAGGIVQRMGEDVHLRVAPFDEFAIHPDLSVAVVIGTGHFTLRSAHIGSGLRMLRAIGPVWT